MKKPEWMHYVLDSVWDKLSNEEQNELYQKGLERGWDQEEEEEEEVYEEDEVFEVCENKPMEFDWQQWLDGERKMSECPLLMPEWVFDIVYGKEV